VPPENRIFSFSFFFFFNFLKKCSAVPVGFLNSDLLDNPFVVSRFQTELLAENIKIRQGNEKKNGINILLIFYTLKLLNI